MKGNESSTVLDIASKGFDRFSVHDVGAGVENDRIRIGGPIFDLAFAHTAIVIVSRLDLAASDVPIPRL